MKGLPWFRLYVDFLEDPKIVSLAFEDQRHFVCILALKSSGMLDEPCKPELLDRIVAQKIWVDHAAIKEVKRRLVEAGLIDRDWQPVAWERRQCRSDHDPTNAERQRRFKAKKGKNSGNASGNALANASVTPTDIDIDLDTDTDTDTEKSSSSVGVSLESKGSSSKRVSTRTRKPKTPAKTTLPEDFALSDRVQAWAAQKGFDQLEDHLELFRLKAASKGYQYADWDAAFMTAVREDWAGLRKNGNAYPHAPMRQPTKQDRYLDSLHKLTGGLAGKSLENTGEYGNVVDITAASARVG